MELKICQICKRPFLADKKVCPDCPPHYVWNRKSWTNLGCLLLATVVPLLLLVLLWILFLAGIIFQ